MFLRILLYLLYLLIPIIIIFVTSFTINISSNKQTVISYTISTKDLINPDYIYYTKPEDIMHKSSFYLSDEILQIMTLNDYLKSNGIINFDLKNLCNLDFLIEKKEIKVKSFDELSISIQLLNANKVMLEKADNCINLFIDNLNHLLFLKFNKDETIERINYNINILDLIVSQFYIDTEKYYSETRAQIIINTFNIIEKALYDAIESFNELKLDSTDNKELKILNELLDKLNKQEDILSSFNVTGHAFTEDFFSFTPVDANSEKVIYYSYILQKLKSIKSSILDNEVSLKITDVKITKDIESDDTLITPGFVLFILLLSSLIIIIIEFLYRKFRY